MPFHVVESYKAIRTNIVFTLSTYDNKIIAVSSANPAEGKSMTAANIVIAAAQGGKKVLLIDADMRKPVQHKIFGLVNKRGLLSVISKMCKADDCIHKNVMENLDVMTAGPIPPNPSELLSSEASKKMFEKLNEKYSMIIVDLPPICVVSDAATLSNDVAGLIMVVRYGKTSFDDVTDANKRMELAQMNILGYVLNDIKTKGHSGYYSKYKYKYKYNSYYSYDNKSNKKADKNVD
ncbi:MAG: CpsD/CapB family tyrosine-protein kinase [Ruminococcus sp.]|nr:CpsD/CapB family tyrosine-protein kinase [Ruminococcus sp.]